MNLRRMGIACTGMLVMAGACMGQGKTPHPALVVLNKAESELAIVDPGTLKVVAKVKTGPIPHEVAVSADGKIAVTTNYGAERNGTTLSVIDLDAQKEIQRVELKDLVGPHGIAYFRGKFYFTAEGSRMIGRYDAAANRVDWTRASGQEGTHMLVPTADGKAFYTANIRSNSVSEIVFDSQGEGSTITNIPVGKGPEGIDISPDGKEVWAANSGDGTVSVIDTATKKVVTTIAVGTKRSNRLKFAPDGTFVLISDLDGGDVLVVAAAMRRVLVHIERGKEGRSAEGILMQPDGKRAFVALSADDKVAVVDLKKLEVTKTFETGKEPDGMAWAK
jgi:YVTN family beta-propeller protein